MPDDAKLPEWRWESSDRRVLGVFVKECRGNKQCIEIAGYTAGVAKVVASIPEKQRAQFQGWPVTVAATVIVKPECSTAGAPATAPHSP